MECNSGKRIALVLSVLLLSVLATGFAVIATAGDPHSAYYDQANDRVFWFIQASDTHIGASGAKDSQNLSWLVNKARQVIDPSFIMVSGDLTDSTNGNFLGWPNGPYQSEWDEYKSIVNIPGITPDNYYDIPGNHDAYNDRYFAYYLANSVQGKATGKTQISFTKNFDFGKYHFLGVNTAGNTGEPFSLSYPWGDPAGLDEDELSFIADALAANSDSDLTLVFGHHPLWPTGNSTDTYLYYGLEDFLALINQSYSSLYGYGHTHESEEAFFIPSSSQHDGFFYFNVNSLGKSSPSQYTIMAIDCNGFSSKTLDIASWPAVLITTPLDDNLGGHNPYTYTVPASSGDPIRALVFDPGAVSSVRYRIDASSTWQSMSPVSENPHLWEAFWNAASVSPGQHTIEVSASSAQGTSSDLIAVSVEQTSQPSMVGAAFDKIGTYETSGKGKNKTIQFMADLDSIFQIGDDIVFRLRVVDEGGVPISAATVQMEISGPESHQLTSTPSDNYGIVEVVWQTLAPNKRGRGGTTGGTYTAKVTGVMASGYIWNSDTQTKQFEIR